MKKNLAGINNDNLPKTENSMTKVNSISEYETQRMMIIVSNLRIIFKSIFQKNEIFSPKQRRYFVQLEELFVLAGWFLFGANRERFEVIYISSSLDWDFKWKWMLGMLPRKKKWCCQDTIYSLLCRLTGNKSTLKPQRYLALNK